MIVLSRYSLSTKGDFPSCNYIYMKIAAIEKHNLKSIQIQVNLQDNLASYQREGFHEHGLE